jgi:hypothetical protein
MHDYLLAEQRWHYIVAISKGLEYTFGHELSQRLEKQLLAHQRDTAADYDAAGTDYGDHLSDRFSK